MKEQTVAQKIESALLSRYDALEVSKPILPKLVSDFLAAIKTTEGITINDAEKLLLNLTRKSPPGTEEESKENIRNSVYEVKYNGELKEVPFMYHGTCNFFAFMSIMIGGKLSGIDNKVYFYANKKFCGSYSKQWTEEALKSAGIEAGIDMNSNYFSFDVATRSSFREPIILAFERDKIQKVGFDRIVNKKVEYSAPSPVTLTALTTDSKAEVMRTMLKYVENTPTNIAELKSLLELK